MPTSVHIPTAAELATRAPGQTIEAHYNAVQAARDGHYERVQVIRRRSEVSRRDLTKSEERTFRAHLDQVEDLSELLETIGNSPEARAIDRSQIITATGGSGGSGGSNGTVWRAGDGTSDFDAPTTRGGPDAELALRTVEQAHSEGLLPDDAAEKVTALVEQGPWTSRSLSARWAITAGAPEYRTAFAKLLADPQKGHLLWTGAEHQAYQRVAAVQAEMRAMSVGTDSAGGYMVPLTLDPSILLSSAGSINPLRQISRVVQTATDQWQGVTSAGSTAEWKAEAAEVADASPALAPAPIPVHFGDAFVPYSFEVGMDAPNFLRELQMVLIDAADQLMATAYTTGSGTGQPKGIITALAGTASDINGGGTEALAMADAYTIQNALPPRFQARAQWCANLAIINTLAQFETTNGALQFPEIRQYPPQLLRKPLHELSNMDGAINAAATANNYLLLYGDFTNFVIVDRIGTTLELVPHLFGANQRPTGQRGALLWFRTGSDVVVPNAFRMLDVPTTA
ncbi:MAG: phage major capsid protein [Pseudonocardiaceae bacterium]